MVLYAGGAKPSKGSSGGDSSGGGSVDLSEVNAQINTLKNGKASTSLDNLTSSGNAKFDGTWVSANKTIQNGVTMEVDVFYEYDLSSILPNDGHDYECIWNAMGLSGKTLNQSVRIKATMTDEQYIKSASNVDNNTTYIGFAKCVTEGQAFYYNGNFVSVVGAKRGIKLLNKGAGIPTNCCLFLVAYRRMGG